MNDSLKQTDHIVVNGYPCVLVVEYRTSCEPKGPWQCVRHIETYRSMKDLNKELPWLIRQCPEGWEVHIDFQDDVGVNYAETY